MENHRWHWLPIVLVTTGVLAVCVAAASNYAVLGWWEVVIFGGCLVALAAAFWFRRKLNATEIELEALRHRLAADETRLEQERKELEQLRRTALSELESQSHRVEKREQALADRLVTYHEWMEFPQPVELSRPVIDDKQLAELARKDREMLVLLKKETKLLYDRILKNRYVKNDQLQLPIIRDDLVLLIAAVTRIYRPDIKEPLLEASLPRIFRAISRASLQMLVILDELPLNLKNASLITLYGYIRNAVAAWRMYKSTEPYWPYVNTAWYLGRFAMGVHPLTLGAWWFLGEVGKQGATAFTQHLINRQALGVLSNVIRVIGYEVAGIHGGDFRHRDPNWIYAAELTELLSEFPLSRDSLAHALREVGTLELRSEYDRTFLYRCVASRKSAEPAQYHAALVLTMEERRAMATRLERFLEAFIHGKSSDKVQRWKAGAEARLGLKLSVSLQNSVASVRDQLVDAVRSLASFIVSIKQLEPPEAVQQLQDSLILAELPPEDRQRLLAELAASAPFFFEHPDLDPDSDLVHKYLDDLAALHARLAPREAQLEDTLDDVAAYLRCPPKKMHALVEKHYALALERRLPLEAPGRKSPREAIRAALDLLEGGEPARFLYGPAKLDWPDGSRAALPTDGPLWLLGVGQRLLLFAAGNQPRVLWRGQVGNVHAENTRHLLAAGCRLTGGEWLGDPEWRPLAIRLRAPLVGSYHLHFGPLLAMIEGRPNISDQPSVVGN
jgi:hypothetical protein